MTTLFLLFLLALGAFAWVNWIEPNWFRLRRVSLRLKKPLGRSLEILHLSDLHFTKERFFLARFFDRLAWLEPDFVFVTGDLIDSPGGIEPCVSNLKKLKPKKGVFVVLGNHDYKIYGPFDHLIKLIWGKDKTLPRPETEALQQALRRAGFHLLQNQNISVPLGEAKDAVVIGIDDPITGRADLNQAFYGIQNGILRLALVHAPGPFPSLSRRGIDLAFAGHTHGGQIRLPGLGSLPALLRLDRVLGPLLESTTRYGFVGLVSRGLGAHSPDRWRLFCRPEALLVRLEGS